MTKILAAALLLALAAAPSHAADRFHVMHVDDLAQALKSDNPPSVYDANTKGVRRKDGVIPGARLLSNYKKYDVAKELPADKGKSLVFYCASTMCMASHGAAEKAIDNGYTNVSVMVDGIMGWRKAGQPTQSLASAKKAAAAAPAGKP